MVYVLAASQVLIVYLTFWLSCNNDYIYLFQIKQHAAASEMILKESELFPTLIREFLSFLSVCDISPWGMMRGLVFGTIKIFQNITLNSLYWRVFKNWTEFLWNSLIYSAWALGIWYEFRILNTLFIQVIYSTCHSHTCSWLFKNSATLHHSWRGYSISFFRQIFEFARAL